ncbi:hypothetical protein Tco_1141362 [Tanacetum coccineum]
MAAVEVPQTLEYRGGQLNVAPVLEGPSDVKESRVMDLKLCYNTFKYKEDRAFGDLIAISGITDDMLDSLMALKDLDDVPGLPPLSTIEDMHYGNNTHDMLDNLMALKDLDDVPGLPPLSAIEDMRWN